MLRQTINRRGDDLFVVMKGLRMSDKLIEDCYLGDGVYASWDGYQIWLDLRGQDSTTRIALDAEVYTRLLEFVAALKAEVEAITHAPVNPNHPD